MSIKKAIKEAAMISVSICAAVIILTGSAIVLPATATSVEETYSESTTDAGDRVPYISVALPGSFKLAVDPYCINMPDADTQILSPEYEIVNYGNQDVVVEIAPMIMGEGFELVAARPERGTDLVSENASQARAIYLEMLVEGQENGLVMSTEQPGNTLISLTAADESGVPSTTGKAKIRFRGNVDPKAVYHDGDLKIRAEFKIQSTADDRE